MTDLLPMGGNGNFMLGGPGGMKRHPRDFLSFEGGSDGLSQVGKGPREPLRENFEKQSRLKKN